LARGRYVSSSETRNKQARLAIDATLRAAAPFQTTRRLRIGSTLSPANRIKITKSDLRFKRFKSRSGMLFIFAVDASGSMALNRMAQAKGALARLLQQAYLHRDKVALISFRRTEAETLLAPTRSVELAKRLVDALPSGGGTPVAAAVVKALEVARLARLRGITQAMLVLLTDGRSNVGLRDEMIQERFVRSSEISEELQALGAALQSANIASVVIDTKSRFVSSGEGRKLAESLGGRYLYLPRADDAVIHHAVATLAEETRRKKVGEYIA
ncbi:MAG TPA: VWA domain-containing protein, partial [Blastocatellia bacterium]|nr:VWA domain-containing protein [Blastocatellia bacterium]